MVSVSAVPLAENCKKTVSGGVFHSQSKSPVILLKYGSISQNFEKLDIEIFLIKNFTTDASSLAFYESLKHKSLGIYK